MKKKMKQWSTRKRIVIGSLCAFMLLYIGVILWHTYKPLPAGVSYAGEIHRTDDVQLFTDLTFAEDRKGTGMKSELEIFDEVYTMIDEAEEFVVLDFFLFDPYSDENIDFPDIVQSLTAHLLLKKQQHPDMPIIFITDPYNTGYGSYTNEWLEEMEDAGIQVVYTDLDRLRDSTPIYSGFYRIFFQWTDFEQDGWLPNAMASQMDDMKLSSYLKLFNIKANHRKVVITEKAGLISSANPHNASGLHGNAALKVTGPILNDMLEAEEAVMKFSGGGDLPRVDVPEADGEYQIQYLTESKILNSLLSDLESTEKGDTIWMGMFYLAKRDILSALVEAAERGVEVKLILDPNANAFGNEKTGLPNRPVVNELLEDSENRIQVRWYNTVAGQYHTKLVYIKSEEQSVIYNGATNLTERSLDDYNLESELKVIAPNSSDLDVELEGYFKRLWTNDGAMYTLDTEVYQDEMSFIQRGIYGMQVLLKLTTF
ncbi:phospholipase D family protein [Chungangia koreensis]|uniref:Phospholipase D family protein n=1 Tax=Chungangia koreensis TaxID=752657 RepID=A0ABV8X5T0_9LACT